MKKTLGIFPLLVLFLACLEGQTIVSTSPQNRNVLLEVFGGIYCNYSPAGDVISKSLKENHPAEVVVINIHTGYFANPYEGDPDFRTEWGADLDLLAGTGQIYPSGMVNRQVFPGYELANPGATAMGREYWNNAAAEILDQPSPLNLAIEADFNPATNEISVYVEIFYTSDSEAEVNFLNIVLLQNHIIGLQLFENGYPDYNYTHDYVLRDMLNEQWGSQIDTTTAGHFEARTYTFTLPSNFKDILVQPGELEIAAFVTESQQQVITAVSVPLTTNLEGFANDASIWDAMVFQNDCGGEAQAELVIRNDGLEPLTSLFILYSINGGPAGSLEWTGNLETLYPEKLSLPPIAFEAVSWGENQIEVSLANPNGQPDEQEGNDSLSENFENLPASSTQFVLLELRTDNYGYEIYWEFLDAGGNVFAFGGNQNVGVNGGGRQTAAAGDPGAYSNNQLIIESIELPDDGCYLFRILDDYGDGFCCDFGYGFFRVKDDAGGLVLNGGEFERELIAPFQVQQQVTDIEGILQDKHLLIFPNPSNGELINLQFKLLQAADLEIAIVNSLGQVVRSSGNEPFRPGEYTRTVNTSGLANGLYFLYLKKDSESISRKFVIHKY